MKEIKLTEEQKLQYKIKRAVILDNGKYIIWWIQGNPSGCEYSQDDLFFLLHKIE